MVVKLSVRPEYIDDISILVNALFELEKLEQRNNKPYVFKYIQQPMIGGTCYAVPADSSLQNNDCVRILGIYDKQFLKNRIQELSKY